MDTHVLTECTTRSCSLTWVVLCAGPQPCEHCSELTGWPLSSLTRSGSPWWLLRGPTHCLLASGNFQTLISSWHTALRNYSSISFIGFPLSSSLIPSFPWNPVLVPFLFLVYIFFLDKLIQTLGLKTHSPHNDFPTASPRPFLGFQVSYSIQPKSASKFLSNLHYLSQINGTTITWIQKPSPAVCLQSTVCPRHMVAPILKN